MKKLIAILSVVGIMAVPALANASIHGAGTEDIGTLNIRQGSTITWTCQGCLLFSVSSDINNQLNDIELFTDNQSHGKSFVAKGKYPNVDVDADSLSGTPRWTITITRGNHTR